jgi:hypothetical protein
MADDTRWMTYAELAEILRIGADSARNLVRRKRWTRRAGNDGLARIEVPVEHLIEHARPDAPLDAALDAGTSPPSDIPTAIAVLERHVERLERELAAAVAERETQRERAGLVAVLEAVFEVERRRVAEAREEAERWRQLAIAPRGFWAWLRNRACTAVAEGESRAAAA